MAPAEDGSRPPFAGRFLEGVEHFNALRFWEAHEAWEELWLASGTEMTGFLQSLIQLAAAWHHVRRGTLPGAVRLFDAAIARLEPYPPAYCGIDRPPLIVAARVHREWAAARLGGAAVDRPDFPRIALLPDWQARIPQAMEW